jgi:hypothetical protein
VTAAPSRPSPPALLARTRALGVRVRINGDNIALRPIVAVPDDLKAELKAAKPDILALLRAEAEANAVVQASASVTAATATATRNAAATERSKADAEALAGPFPLCAPTRRLAPGPPTTNHRRHRRGVRRPRGTYISPPSEQR